MSNVLALRALKGAPLSCLIALGIAGRPVGVTWLSTATGFEKKAVIAGLRVLESLSLAANAARYNGWQLTPAARALPLMLGTGMEAEEQGRGGEWDDGEQSGGPGAEEQGSRGAEGCETHLKRVTADAPARSCKRKRAGGARSVPGQGGREGPRPGEVCDADLEAGEEAAGGPIPALPGSSGGSLNNHINHEDAKNQPPPPAKTRAADPIAALQPPGPEDDPAVASLVEMLTIRCACPRGRARQAAALGMRHGRSAPWLEIEVMRWMVYCGERGTNIVSIGHFIASKIAVGDPAPDWVRLTEFADQRRERELRRADEEESGSKGDP